MPESEHRPIRMLVVDDHEIVRRLLRSVLSQDPEIEIVGEAASAGDAVLKATQLKPRVVLLDLRLPDGNGIDVCRKILAASPQTRVLFLTSYADEDGELAAMVAGGQGYLAKEIGSQDLIRSIKVVAAGQSLWACG